MLSLASEGYIQNKHRGMCKGQGRITQYRVNTYEDYG